MDFSDSPKVEAVRALARKFVDAELLSLEPAVARRVLRAHGMTAR